MFCVCLILNAICLFKIGYEAILITPQTYFKDHAGSPTGDSPNKMNR